MSTQHSTTAAQPQQPLSADARWSQNVAEYRAYLGESGKCRHDVVINGRCMSCLASGVKRAQVTRPADLCPDCAFPRDMHDDGFCPNEFVGEVTGCHACGGRGYVEQAGVSVRCYDACNGETK